MKIEKGFSKLETVIILIAIVAVGSVFAFTLLYKLSARAYNYEVNDVPSAPHNWCGNATEITSGMCITFQSSKNDEPKLISDRRTTDGDIFYKVCLAKENEQVVKATFTIDTQTLAFTIPVAEESSYTHQVGDMFLQRDKRRFLVRFPYWWKVKEIK